MLISYTNLKPEEFKHAMSLNFGARMLQARELCGLEQIEAAPLFGFANSSRLSKIESPTCESLAYIQPKVLVPAVLNYGVSADFLFGFSNYPQRDVKQSRENQVADLLTDLIANEIADIRRLVDTVNQIAKQTQRFAEKTQEIQQALDRFRQLNPDFDDMSGGAKLDRLVCQLRQDAKHNANELAELRQSLQ
ncbi:MULTISPECIES: hypothetical protein [Methylomonas]|uniref:Uncharacterized protein n=1 Tax=Methylomonas koyamae TaxID=702114 RepID=A0A177P6K6_9GAMM|nr:hypothetical protein [Methylomonas koyamae]OAI25083.1 hypothetical protein A1355_20140 [Methylomonas koyamae]